MGLHVPCHLAQNALAHRLGITLSHLSRLLNGTRSPSPRMLLLRLEVLGCSEF